MVYNNNFPVRINVNHFKLWRGKLQLTAFQCLGDGQGCDVEDGELVVGEINKTEIVFVEESVVSDITDLIAPQNDGLQAGEER